MPRFASRFSRLTLATLVAAGGCASLPAPTSHRELDMAARFERLLDSVATASALEADEVAGAPRIRLVVPTPTAAMGPYVESSFHLSSDAYVLVVAVDQDRRVRVLYPDLPDQSGFAPGRDATRLMRFFAGFGHTGGAGRGYYQTRYDITQRLSPFGGIGVLLAVASDRPLQFERLLGPDGEWDEQALSRLVFDQSMPGAARALGQATVLTGQDFNTDYTTFTGDHSFARYAFVANRLDGCGLVYGFGSSYDAYDYGWNRGPAIAGPRFVGLFQRNGVTFARYAQGGCAGASYYDVPVSGVPRPVSPDSAAPDSTVRRRPLHPWAPRVPRATDDASEAAGREVHVRLEAPTAADGRERPVSVAGLRFRTPGELSDAGERAGEVRLAPRDARIGRAPVRDAERQQLPERSLEPRAVRGREAQPVREPAVRDVPPRDAPQRETPQRELPVREAPAREAPVRAEPVREAPVRHEPVQREPVRERVERVPVPVAPATP